MHTCVPVVFLAVAGSISIAQPDLYISEYKFNDAQMSAVGIDGTNSRTLFALPPAQWLPIGLTFRPSNGRLYWLDAGQGAVNIMSATADGSGNSTVVTVPGFGRGASVDSDGRIYFTAGTSLHRVNADGSGLMVLFTGSRPNTMGNPRVDATNGHVYVGTDGKIFRMNLDGTDRKTIVRGGSTIRAIGLDISNAFIYWIDCDTITDFVGRARLDGSDFTILIDNSPMSTGSSGYGDLLVDPASGYLFVADDFRNDVRRYPIAGGGFTTLFSSALDRSPSGLILSTGEPSIAVLDCNTNGVPDQIEITNGAADCDNNGFLDSCQVNPCPNRTFLLDQGSDAENSSGRAVGVPSGWQVFQPFDVPPGGWEISEIAIDGYMSDLADQSGLTIKVFPDDGTLTRPNESNLLAQAPVSLLFTTYDVNWRYAPVDLSLPQGRFWVRIEARKPNITGASINHGFSGLPSISRGISGNFTAPASPIALQIVRKPSCPADFDGSGFVDTDDFDAFVHAFEIGEDNADFDGSGFVDTDDFDAFVRAFEFGC